MLKFADSRRHGRYGPRNPDCKQFHGKLGLRAGIGEQHTHAAEVDEGRVSYLLKARSDAFHLIDFGALRPDDVVAQREQFGVMQPGFPAHEDRA